MQFALRPHIQWKQNADGSALLIDGKLQAVLDANGQAVIRAYTVAIAQRGDTFTTTSSAPPVKWPKFKTKKAALLFAENHKSIT